MTIDRRAVAKMLTVLPLAACIRRVPTSRTFDAGVVDAFAPRSATRFHDHGVIVVRDDAGVMAVSAVCTHAGCTVGLTSHGLQCPCHGATFTMTGDVLDGPAKRPLPHFRVTREGDRLRIHLEEHVAATERLAL